MEIEMAVTGPKPTGKAVTQGRAKVETTDVLNVPYDGPKPELPTERKTMLKNGDIIIVPIGDDTVAWWERISIMPHCVLWSESDWQFALDTAKVHSAAQNGSMPAITELRQREKILGTTWEARRDLRINYVDPEAEKPELSPVATLDDRRKKLLDA